MKSSLLRNLMGYRNLSRDQIGIRLALVLGISGQLIVFLIPDPLWILAPQIPMLSPQHWPGSQINTELFLTHGWQPWGSSAPYRPFSWEEKRGFYHSLFLSQGTAIDQTIVWYADPGENAYVWHQLPPDEYNGWPIIERRKDTDQPVSFLACNPDLIGSPPQCWYLAYWGHWMTGFFSLDSRTRIFSCRIFTNLLPELTNS